LQIGLFRNQFFSQFSAINYGIFRADAFMNNKLAGVMSQVSGWISLKLWVCSSVFRRRRWKHLPVNFSWNCYEAGSFEYHTHWRLHLIAGSHLSS